jgi:ankyrin repeat protein
VDLACSLIEHGADVTTQNNNGWTPLHFAADSYGSDNVNLVRFLVEHGADVMAQVNNGLTPLHWAQKQGRMELAGFLTQK